MSPAEKQAELAECWERVDLLREQAQSMAFEAGRVAQTASNLERDLLTRFGPRPETGGGKQ